MGGTNLFLSDENTAGPSNAPKTVLDAKGSAGESSGEHGHVLINNVPPYRIWIGEGTMPADGTNPENDVHTQNP